MRSLWLNRTICDVLEEMRRCTKTGNYSYLPGLVEEMQSMANRMEAGLEDVKDINQIKDEWRAWKGVRALMREEKKDNNIEEEDDDI